MSTDDEELVPVFMPALSAVLVHAEDTKGEPLTHNEVIKLRDESSCIMMRVSDLQELVKSRGYEDLDPENCWYDWQHLRRVLGRKPDLDPGPKMNQIRGSDAGYQKATEDALASLDQFRAMLPSDGRSLWNASVKTKITEGEHSAFMWLSHARVLDTGFAAQFFEVSDVFKNSNVGDELEITKASLMDWMVNDNGVLHGGFSIRYYRSTLPENERAEYDAYIGVEKYA